MCWGGIRVNMPCGKSEGSRRFNYSYYLKFGVEGVDGGEGAAIGIDEGRGRGRFNY